VKTIRGVITFRDGSLEVTMSIAGPPTDVGVGPARAEVFKTAFEQAPVGIGVCDEDGRFVGVNDSLARLLKLDRDEIVGRPFIAFVHPDHRSAGLAWYFTSIVAAATRPARAAEHGELRCVAGDGTLLWIAVSWIITSPDPTGSQYAIIHMRDVTEHRAVERELAAVRRRVELAFDSAPIGNAMVDMDGRILQTNRALRSTLGYSEAELCGLTFADISHPADRAGAVITFDRLRSGELDVHETVKRYMHRDGHIIHARRVAAAVRQPDGTSEYVLLQLEDITAERLATAQLDQMVVRDQLTELATREFLARQLQLSSTPHTVVLVELDDPARVTSSLGRTETEQLLIDVAQRLTSCCRTDDVIARLGDTEFAILLHDARAGDSAAVATRILDVFATPILTEHNATTITAHVGIATDVTGTAPLDTLLQQANLAAQTNKTAERGSWTTFRPAMLTASARRLALESDLRSAVAAEELSLEYQPIVRLSDGTIQSVEALARWHHDALGAIAPDEFVPLAERSALIDELTAWSLRTGCADLAGWRARHPERQHVGLAINVSVLALANLDFPAIVAGCLADSGIPPDRLILEITETSLAQADSATIANAHLISRSGVRLAMDDFGAGYSSLSRLANFPITELKLDSALTNMATGAAYQITAALLKAAVGIAADLNLTLVAEGIETQSQLELLRQCGCPQGQGYLLGRPQNAETLEQLLAT
jgi:PAS domain S-box-containing protein/diguanylate cyclase (GGDEF)-like protein